jgi:hypothetical protein
MNTLYDNGKYKWRHNDPIYQDGRVVGRLLGPCPRCGSATSTYGGAYSCHSGYCFNSKRVFACSPDPKPKWWNTGISVQMDGDMWRATAEGFIDLMESDAGFGATIAEAVEALTPLSENER